MKALIAGVLLATSLSANAVVSDKCELFGTMAATAMKVRQNNADLQDMLSRSTGNPTVDQTMYQLLRLAYSKPRMAGKAAQQDAIQNFKNGAILECSK